MFRDVIDFLYECPDSGRYAHALIGYTAPRISALPYLNLSLTLSILTLNLISLTWGADVRRANVRSRTYSLPGVFLLLMVMQLIFYQPTHLP